MSERELTTPMKLTLASGLLNTDAVGWARRPLIDTSGINGRRGWPRNKRWEYWNVVTPTHVLAATVSSIDYAAVHEIWVFDRSTQQTWGTAATVLPARGAVLPANLHGGVASARAKDLAIDITAEAGGVRLQAQTPQVSFDVRVSRPADQDCLAVVVPWTVRRFQYTVKDVAQPASGSLTIEGVRHEVPAGQSWAVLDHGRGRWPYDVAWNWGAASGTLADGRSIGLQVGGRWTDGTGSTENGVVVGGVLHKISTPVVWRYDLAAPLRPWRVTGGGLDATFTPFYDKRSKTDLGVLASRTDQCFGEWSGTFAWTGADQVRHEVGFAELVGFAEDVHNRW